MARFYALRSFGSAPSCCLRVSIDCSPDALLRRISPLLLEKSGQREICGGARSWMYIAGPRPECHWASTHHSHSLRLFTLAFWSAPCCMFNLSCSPRTMLLYGTAMSGVPVPTASSVNATPPATSTSLPTLLLLDVFDAGDERSGSEQEYELDSVAAVSGVVGGFGRLAEEPLDVALRSGVDVRFPGIRRTGRWVPAIPSPWARRRSSLL